MADDTLKQQMADRKAERERIRRHKASKKARTKEKHKHRRLRAAKKAAMTPEEVTAQEVERAVKRELKVEELAEQEYARRQLARKHLLPYIQRMQADYIAGWFHKDLCLRLEKFLRDVIAGLEPRLMLFVPPRHGKSQTVSGHFPPWCIGQYPQLEFIQTSYAESLQLDFSKFCQASIRSPEYQQLFPGVIIPRGHEGVSRWAIGLDDFHGGYTLTGGGMLAAGVGGPLTGRGAWIGTIDDPVKNREEADSQKIREGLKSWYSSTFLSRLAPDSGVLVIQTRWHDDDLSGWLLREMASAVKEMEDTGEWPDDADRWDVVSYPAIALNDEKWRKKGEPLHPERYNLMKLLKKKRAMIPRDWTALYQQNPVAEEGHYFTKQMIRYYNPGELPPIWELDIYAAGDLAISEREDADWTVFAIAGLDKHDNIWILDVRRDRWDTDGIVNEILDIYKVWRPIKFGLERDKIAIAIGPVLNRAIRESELPRINEMYVEDLHIQGRDKRLRARPIQGRMAQGKVHVPSGALWTEQWVNEHLRFDSGVTDDCVDAAAWIGQMLADERWQGGRGRRIKKDKSWKDRLKGYSSDATKDENAHMRA